MQESAGFFHLAQNRIPMNRYRLSSRWSINQSLGFILGWALFAIVGHGVTGEHSVYLNTPSAIMHTLGLFSMTLVLLAFQNRVTLKALHVSLLKWWWIYLPSVAVVFWVGYYNGNIPLHGFPVDVFSSFITIATFQLDGQEFIALNGGPQFKFTEAISFVVNCETQEEVDEFWEKLSEGGEKLRCGWLKDRYGVSWQVVPSALGEMLQDKDPEKSKRVMKAMLQMDKIDIKTLRQAYEQ